jgi:hypothetical protein
MPQPTLPAADPGLPITREQVEAHVEALIDLLDSLDADPDLEPSLGFTDTPHWASQDHADFMANGNGGDDRELDDEREPSEDGEPSLGWTNNPNQLSSSWGGHPFFTADDLEQDTGPVRKKRPKSKTGGEVYRGCRVLGCPPTTKSSVPTEFRVRRKGRAKR